MQSTCHSPRSVPSAMLNVIVDSPEAIFNETIAPTSGLLTSDVQLGSDLLIVQIEQESCAYLTEESRYGHVDSVDHPIPRHRGAAQSF